MGLPVDQRIAEYAYISSDHRRPNAEVVTEDGTVKYRHIVTILYEMRGSNKEFFTTASKTHELEIMDERDSYEVASTKINQAIIGWVAADKLSLSGWE